MLRDVLLDAGGLAVLDIASWINVVMNSLKSGAKVWNCASPECKTSAFSSENRSPGTHELKFSET